MYVYRQYIYIYIYVGHLEEQQQSKHKGRVVTFLKPSKGKLLAQLSTSDTPSSVLIFIPYYLCLFFSGSFRTKPVHSDLRAQEKSLSTVKNVNLLLTLLRHRAIVNFLLRTFQHFSVLFFSPLPFGALSPYPSL